MIPVDVRHCRGSLDPTPRGSKLTSVNLARSEAGNVCEACSRNCTPDAPGPPGLRTMSAIGCGRVATSSTTEIGICRPPESEYDTGTDSVAHLNSWSQLCQDNVLVDAAVPPHAPTRSVTAIATTTYVLLLTDPSYFVP